MPSNNQAVRQGPKRQSEAANVGYNNTQLMKAMGSESGQWDPMAPQQYLWHLDNGKPTDQAVAWVQAHTLGRDHRTPFATDVRGRKLYIEHFAVDREWELKTARNVMYAAQAEGRIRLDTAGKRIYLCAEITPEPQEEGRTEDERFARVQSQFPPYVVDFLRNMPAEKREAAIARYKPFWDWHKQCAADAMASLRAFSAPIEDTILLELGYDKKRLPQRRAAPAKVKIEVLDIPEFTSEGWLEEPAEQHHNCDFVQRQNGSVQTDENGSYKHALGYVQNSPPYCLPDPHPDPDNRAPSAHTHASSEPVCRSGDRSGDRQTDEIARVVSEEGARLGEAAGPKLLAKIAEALGDAPIELLEAKIRKRRRAITSLGLLVRFAGESRAVWDAQAERRAIDAAETAAQQAELDAQFAALPPDDPEVHWELCRKCGGRISTYQSGAVGNCACVRRARAAL